MPAEEIEQAVEVIDGFVGDEIPSADKINNLGVITFFEASEAFAFLATPEIKGSATQTFTVLNGFPKNKIIGHDIFVFRRTRAVGVVKKIFVFKQDPSCDNFIFVSGSDEGGEVIFEILPHEVVIAFGMGVKALSLDGFFSETKVFIEGFVGIINFNLDAFFFGESDIVAGFAGEATH